MGEEHHCACFETASSHIDKIFRMLSSSILCVMTSTDNIKCLSILQCLFIGVNIVVIA